MNTADSRARLLIRLDGLQQIPTIPAVLAPLLRYLQQPMEHLDLHKITDMISQDESLTAQCLQMANSPLFGRAAQVGSLRAAVLGLGFHRVSDIAMTCGVLHIAPKNHGLDPVLFWEHSLGCALVCRHLAQIIHYPDPSKAYLAGLLHDLGIVVNLWLLPKEFGVALELARREGIPLHEAEQSILGFTHCDSGRLLAQRWQLPTALCEAVSCHHAPSEAHDDTGLVGLVELSDLLCRMSGLNHGYMEKRQVNLLEHAGFALLAEHCHELKKVDWARLTFEMDSYIEEVQALVRAIYRA